MKLKKDYLIIIPILLVIINIVLLLTNNIYYIDNYVYSLIKHYDILTKFLTFITDFGSTIYIVSFCVILLPLYKDKKDLFNLYGILIISTIINNVIKIIIRRPRPILMGSIVPIFESTYSFPSGHAMASTTFYGFLIYLIIKSKLNKRKKVLLTIILSLLIFMILFSRIYLYIHYFSDVLCGMCISIILLYIFIKLLKYKEVKNGSRVN